jgi:hypothetical protein
MTLEILLEEFKKIKDEMKKVGLIKILAFTFSYFFVLFLIPIIILSALALVFQIPIPGEFFSLIALIVFLGYFIQDFIQLSRAKFTITMVVIVLILVAILLVVKVLYHR